MTKPLLSVRGLVKHFASRAAGVFNRTVTHVRAVDGVDFDIQQGETFGLVGESGCGKTTTGRLVLRMLEPTAGSIKFNDQELLSLSAEEMRLKRQQMQIIFQDPYGSLDPRMTVNQIVEEPLQIHHIGDRTTRSKRVAELLDMVGQPYPEVPLRACCAWFDPQYDEFVGALLRFGSPSCGDPVSHRDLEK